MTEPMKTAEQILIKHLGTAGCLETEYIEELTDEPGFIESVKAMTEYAAQQVAAERERIKDTLNKVQGSWSYQQVIDLIDSL